MDFAVLEHRFAKHGRDYILLVEDCLGSDPGQHEIVFTHCVKAECETRVTDEAWLKSWSEEFTDYQRWTGAEAASWTRRIGKDMFEARLVGNGLFLLAISFSFDPVSEDERRAWDSFPIHPPTLTNLL